jgi:hypothetical protein
MSFDDEPADAFSRVHGVFTFHLGVAVALAWMTALYAALHAPWVRDIRSLLDSWGPGSVESTGSFLFGMPVLLTLAWVLAVFGRDLLRRARLGRSRAVEFAIAAAVAFGIFYVGVERAVAAILLSGS